MLAPALTKPECEFPHSWSNMVCASAPELRAALDGLTRGVTLDTLDDCAATAGAKILANAATKRAHAASSLARPNHKEMAKETAQVRRDPSLELGAARAPLTVCWE